MNIPSKSYVFQWPINGHVLMYTYSITKNVKKKSLTRRRRPYRQKKVNFHPYFLSTWLRWTAKKWAISHGTCNSEIGAHVRSKLCYLICIRRLIISRAVTNRIIFSEKTYLPLCVRNMFWCTIEYTVCPGSSDPT